MATFKVGQRVRRIGQGSEPHIFGSTGQCGVVTGFGYAGQIGALDVRYDDGLHAISCEASRFAPLTDPSADAFVSRMKNLKPYEEPVAPKSKVRA